MSSSSKPYSPMAQIFGGNSDIGKFDTYMHGASDAEPLQAAPPPPTRDSANKLSLDQQLSLELNRRGSDTKSYSGGNTSSLADGRGDTNRAPAPLDQQTLNFQAIQRYFGVAVTDPRPTTSYGTGQVAAGPNRFGAESKPNLMGINAFGDTNAAPPASRVLLGV